MAKVTIDRTGVLVVGGNKTFPIGVSNPPPLGKNAPNGKPGLEELASVGMSFVRSGHNAWDAEFADGQIALERKLLDAVAHHGMHCWLWLGDLTELPPRAAGKPVSQREKLLKQVVDGLKGHPGLGAWKGVDEPANPARGKFVIPPAPLVRGYKRMKQLDPDHPLVIIQAPRSTVAQLAPYRPAFDITGVDIFPVGYPPAKHSDSPNRDISVVGDMTRKMVAAGGGKPVWTTLQIAWAGTVRSKKSPAVVPLFPTLREERFMAYQAIVSGARGLMFFGGHLTQVTNPADAKAGWNWTFWRQVLRPLVSELASAALRPALIAPNAAKQVKTSPHTSGATDVEVVTRRGGNNLYVIAVKRGGAAVPVDFTGLPAKRDGSPITRGEVLFEYVQEPPPPPFNANKQVLRPIAAAKGGFRDIIGPKDVRVYRFAL